MAHAQDRFRVILFDVGGVLTELSGMGKLLSWLQDDVTAEQARALWLASPTVRMFETGRMPAAAFAERMIGELGLLVDADEFLAELCVRGQRVLPGSVDLVRRVPRDLVRATLCNTNELQWHSLSGQGDLLDAFDHHFASHLTGKIKPDRDAFEHVLATLDCDGCEVLFLDDSATNVAAAERAGMAAFHVAGLAQSERALRTAGILTA
ncbi:MAG TPA: HAD-IA family hydrolase [Candidatus Aquilonibacter sp.]|nr:HAD-IA family hydrolase [Candidatus Aquilonibacter sp.]